MTETWGRGKRFGIVRLAGRCTGGTPPPRYPRVPTPTTTWPTWALAIAAGTRRSRSYCRPSHYQLCCATTSTTWTRLCHATSAAAARVVLLGDAAHALTPDLRQGARLALEDAVTLAASANRQADVPAALAAYDQARRARTQRLVRVSAQFGRIAQWQGPLAARLRDACRPHPGRRLPARQRRDPVVEPARSPGTRPTGTPDGDTRQAASLAPTAPVVPASGAPKLRRQTRPARTTTRTVATPAGWKRSTAQSNLIARCGRRVWHGYA